MKPPKKTKKALWLQIREDSNPVNWADSSSMALPTRPKSIKRRTAKREKEERIYRAMVKGWIIGKKCGLWSCRQPATECHHQFGRIGSLLLREDLWIPLCNLHHREVHENPEWARQNGLLCPKGIFNTSPK